VIRRLAAGCLLPGFSGTRAPDWLRALLADGLGGVVLFGSNIESSEQVAGLAAELRAEHPELLIATDEEGGDVTRLESSRGSSYPGNWALGVVDDPDLTERVAGAIASDLARARVNMNLAPVADVNSNPDNPVIGIRSFGSDPELVARHVGAFVRGLQDAGVAACVKHFPGHGDTREDSHLEPASTEFHEEMLLPFRAAIEAGVRAVMTAHVRVLGLDGAPATLSRPILTGLLREDLGFEGLIVTDALEMRAISATVGLEEGAVRALEAGADALCLGAALSGEEVVGLRDAIVAAVRAGRLQEERLREAAARVRGLSNTVLLADGADRAAGVEAARRALRVEGIVAGPHRLVAEFRPDPLVAAGEAHHGLGDFLPGARVVVVREGEPVPRDASIVVVRDAHRHAWQRDALANVGQVVVVETGIPLWRPDGAAGYVATHGGGRVNLEAAAEALRG
jgi:beta-N-acetylhexosaminidase